MGLRAKGETVLVNGQVRPEATAAPGERELWRVVNACPARYLRLTLDGQTVRLSGRDVGAGEHGLSLRGVFGDGRTAA